MWRMTTSSIASTFAWFDSTNPSSRQTQEPKEEVDALPQFLTVGENASAPTGKDVPLSSAGVTFQGGDSHSFLSPTAPISVTELTEYLEPFASYFKRSEGRQSLERHLTGLLIDINRKNGEQIAHAVAGTNSQRLQALLTELQWDATAMNERRVRQLIREATTRGGILVCGETEMLKQGSSSVGVARQYVDSLEKIKNCQLILSCQYVDAAFSWPINARLYLPQEWLRDTARCQRARIPEESRTFLSKADIVLSLLDEATRLDVPYRGIATSAAYGSESSFLLGLEQREVTYLVAVPEEFEIQVARRKSPMVASAKESLAKLAESAWQPLSWPRSTGYGSRSLWTRVMCWRKTSEGQGSFGWLVGERPLGGQASGMRYYFTNANLQTPLSALARLAKRTIRVEEFYRFAKSDLGWNHYEGRLWHGFYRHTLLVFLAYSFLLRLRFGRADRRG
jgi:SRSO17 transposase